MAVKCEKRPIRVEGHLAYVPLTQGYEAIIDVADVPMVSGCNWGALVVRRNDGSIRTVYAQRRIGGRKSQKTVYLHRVLLPSPEDIHIDHIDGNGLNNCRSNLRQATRVQNMCNQRLRVDNQSGAKGVFMMKLRGKWTARIAVNGRKKCLGSFNCRTAAAIAYAKASRDLHGEFGRTA